MSINTEIERSSEVITNKLVAKSKEVDFFKDFFKDFEMDNIIFSESLRVLNVSTYNKKTKENDISQMCSLIYPSKWFKDDITKQVKFEVTFLINKKFEKIILQGDIKKNDFLNILRGYGFSLKDNKGDVSNQFLTYFFNILTYLYDSVEPSKLVSQFGLQDDGGFAIGTKYINKDGSLSECDTSTDLKFLVNDFKPKGELERFKNNLNDFFQLKGVSKHKFYALCLMSTPILSILDKKGSVINFYSQESGLNKSSTQTIAQLFYRSKSQLDNGFTPLSVLKEASLVSGLPILIEEFSPLMRKNPDAVLQLIHKITGGIDNKRMDKNANQIETKEFRVNLGGSSNITMYSIIPPESIAELVRNAEISLTPKECNSEDMDNMYLMYERMKEDCGYGYIYITKLMEQKLALRDIFNTNFKNIAKNLFQDDRFRFVANTFACAMTFATLLKDMKVKIDMKEIEDIMKVIINDTLNNFNSNLISRDKILNDLLSLLKINHATQEIGKTIQVVKTHQVSDALIINLKDLVIPKSIFDTKIAMSTDKRIKSMFGLTNKELFTILNEKGDIVTIQQKTYDDKRTQCVVIRLPIDFTTSILEIVKDEVDEDNPYAETKIRKLK